MAWRQIARAVTDAIEHPTQANEPATERHERVERLTEALEERLDARDALDEIGNRPADAIIRDICRDLGIAHLDLDKAPQLPPTDRPDEAARQTGQPDQQPAEPPSPQARPPICRPAANTIRPRTARPPGVAGCKRGTLPHTPRASPPGP